MGHGLTGTSRVRRTGGRALAVGLAGLLAWSSAAAGGASALPGPELEYEWEVGTVKAVYDGDTLDASISRSNSGFTGTQRVRTVGVQAPETYHAGEFQEQCGAADATRFLKSVAPVGAPVQLRAMKGTSFDTTDGRARLVRSVYAQDEEGNWYDTSRELVSSGKAMWFPFADTGEQPEWAHNLEYRVLADDARSEGRGLWARDLCGAWSIPDLNIRMWAKYWGTEQVWIENNGASAIDLSGWIIRDSAIKGFRTLPPGTVIDRAGTPGAVRMVYSGDMNLNNLPADNASFEGDAVYLMEPAGRYGTGNLRAWFPYPCNPDNCDDPLKTTGGGFAMKTPVPSSGPMRPPSKPGSVAAAATTNGSGDVQVTWAAPTDPGGLNLRYTVTASSAPGVVVPAAATGVTTTSHTFTGLTLGRPYSFTVQAVSDGGSSDAVGTTTAVTPAGPPAAPTGLTVEARDKAVAVSWSQPSTGGFDANTITYKATLVGDASKSCTVTGATSCVVDTLVNGAPAAFTVTATNPVASATSVASGPATPAPPILPAVAPSAPTSVAATPGKGSIVVAWPRALTANGALVDSYTAAVDATHACVATNGATSCVITGLADGTAVTATVTATNVAGTSASSPASAAVTPFSSGTTRTSLATAAPPNVAPWSPGYVDLTNNTGSSARLGGYGLWDAVSSRYNNNGSIENRAAYLFDPNLTLAAGATLRVYFGSTSASATAGVDEVAYASGVSAGGSGGFIEMANLNGAQVACMATSGTPCVKAKVTSTPSSPLGVTARMTPSSITVNWGAPVSRGGLPISGYTATAFNDPVNGSAIGNCSTDGTGRSCSFPGSIGTKYWVQVSATNAAGTSAPSWRVLAAPRTVPGAPGSVSASGTPGGINVSWTPAVENGAPVTKYTAAAYRAGTGGSPAGTCTTSTGALNRCTITGLAGGTTYYVDVTATNRAGTGAPSSPRVSAVPGPGSAISTYSKRRVTVRWDAPADPTGITGYTAKVYTKASKGSLLATCTAPVGATSCTTKKLKKRSKFYIDLITQTASGSSVVKPRIVTGPPRKPGRPAVTSAVPNGRQVSIVWAPPSFTGYTTLTSYRARLYSKAKGGSVKASCSAGAGALTCTTKAVKKRGTYYAAVRVKNSKGWSSWSKRLKVVVR